MCVWEGGGGGGVGGGRGRGCISAQPFQLFHHQFQSILKKVSRHATLLREGLHVSNKDLMLFLKGLSDIYFSQKEWERSTPEVLFLAPGWGEGVAGVCRLTKNYSVNSLQKEKKLNLFPANVLNIL
jgi:hypothetical protein